MNPFVDEKPQPDAGHELAKQHVNWLLGMLEPLLIDHMAHGFKHGVEWARQQGDRDD
jgi:hypothetical protein